MPMTDPWDERYIYLHEWLVFCGKLVGKYINPMDPINKKYLSKWCHDQIAGSLSQTCGKYIFRPMDPSWDGESCD